MGIPVRATSSLLPGCPISVELACVCPLCPSCTPTAKGNTPPFRLHLPLHSLICRSTPLSSRIRWTCFRDLASSQCVEPARVAFGPDPSTARYRGSRGEGGAQRLSGGSAVELYDRGLIPRSRGSPGWSRHGYVPLVPRAFPRLRAGCLRNAAPIGPDSIATRGVAAPTPTAKESEGGPVGRPGPRRRWRAPGSLRSAPARSLEWPSQRGHRPGRG